ncbi:hypothetical protein M405DRAFT_822557 [Rhizopogon salebrosus TDB-379]|nr:hypothetical protein M405DRAFT_822557 [Rhizopogon salebrosus TDB-379]
MDSDVTRLLAQPPPQLPRGFFDDALDSVHSSTTHASSSAQRRRHAQLAPSSGSRSHTILGRFSSVFHRSQPIIDRSIKLQPPSRRRSVSSHQSFPAAEVAPVRDRQGCLARFSFDC